ncbi:MAG TPA: hypothetical protein VIO64_03060 [Pseudobacteroides sp.]|uniref:hypothetical protein n=1 Tax=Pseudobacteroides sp. TaxID=1968840 RepID=UPI002F9536E6
MKNKRSSYLVKALSIVLCLTFLFMTSSTIAFAGKNDPAAPKKVEVDSMQTFLLDSIASKNNTEIANYISAVTKKNLTATTESIAKAIKGNWNSKNGQAEIKSILVKYLLFTTKAKLGFTAIIREGISDVVIPKDFSSKIKAKINADITGNSKDDRGLKFMVKSLQIVQKLVTSLSEEKVVTLKLNNLLVPKFEFNRLENYPFVTSSVTEVFQTMNTLPFDGDFDSFTTYYEKFLNSCNVYDAISFLYLLKDNNIQYQLALE